ncbi:MAG: hypothetical protein K9W43_04140 [Candidatus Thorarchaeota archaeon]|nr:hypothetical protein [Candidatus Thorarchaeota archaeon]
MNVEGTEEAIVTHRPPSTPATDDRLDTLESTMTSMLAGDSMALKPSPIESTDADSLPPIDEELLPESELEPIEDVMAESPPPTTTASLEEKTREKTRPEEALEWEVDEESETESTAASDYGEIREIDPSMIREVESTITREIDTDMVREGDPFVEVEPPVPKDMEDMEPVPVREVDPTFGESLEPLREFIPAPEDAKTHLFTEEDPSRTAKAVSHLFPEGKGTTSKEFIEIVVGKPKKIVVEEPMRELETPMCPSCGAVITTDDFKYPDYVYEAMARARMEAGLQLLKRSEHEKAIESFEKAKLLYERANDKKGLEEATRKVDEGYEAMAESHYIEGEQHLKQKEFEWAIVQFRKARELYMFTSLAKMRAKCSERVQRTYEEWGKALESEANNLSKVGDSRRALSLYQEAAEKYRLAGATKRLKGLEKKILRA